MLAGSQPHDLAPAVDALRLDDANGGRVAVDDLARRSRGRALQGEISSGALPMQIGHGRDQACRDRDSEAQQ